VYDTATITVSGGGNLTGSLKFELWDNATCSGTAAKTTTNTINAASGTTSTSDTYTVPFEVTSKDYSWKITYTSTNSAHKGVTGTCANEKANLTYSNGVAEPK